MQWNIDKIFAVYSAVPILNLKMRNLQSMKNDYFKSCMTVTIAVALVLSFFCTNLNADYGHHGDWEHHHGGGSGLPLFVAGAVVGSFFASLPREHTRIIVNGVPYYYYDGVYYAACPNGYVIVNPPMGAVVPAIPAGMIPVVVGSTTYYYAGGVYYLQQPNGYVAVSPPASVIAPVQSVSVPVATPVAAPVPTVTMASSAQAISAPLPPGYSRQGHDWAKDLRDDVVTRDEFINYLRSNIVNASSSNFSEFRNGFITAYGVNGDAAFDKAFQKAKTN